MGSSRKRVRALPFARTHFRSLSGRTATAHRSEGPHHLLQLFLLLLLLLSLPHECTLLSLIHNILPIHPLDKAEEEHAQESVTKGHTPIETDQVIPPEVQGKHDARHLPHPTSDHPGIKDDFRAAKRHEDALEEDGEIHIEDHDDEGQASLNELLNDGGVAREDGPDGSHHVVDDDTQECKGAAAHATAHHHRLFAPRYVTLPDLYAQPRAQGGAKRAHESESHPCDPVPSVEHLEEILKSECYSIFTI